MHWRGMTHAGVAVVIAVTAVRALGLSRGMPRKTADARVARGRYLVSAMGCASCHTPKTMGPGGPRADESRFLAGHSESSDLGPPPRIDGGRWVAVSSWDTTAWAGPWGISYSANLTPDENTGLGSWSEDTFVRALRTGRHMGVSRPILPPMPWGAFRNLSDDDLRAIYAYLRTVTPIRNRVPEPGPPRGPSSANR
jgi:cytochrome c553